MSCIPILRPTQWICSSWAHGRHTVGTHGRHTHPIRSLCDPRHAPAAYNGRMSDLGQRMPHVTAFPHALGCGIILRTAEPMDSQLRARIEALIGRYDHALSRFRSDSLVAAMARAPHGGTFEFPDWVAGLFDLYDRLFAATDGAIDPCVGGELERLGYAAELGRMFRGEPEPKPEPKPDRAVAPSHPHARSQGRGQDGHNVGTTWAQRHQPHEPSPEPPRPSPSAAWQPSSRQSPQPPRMPRPLSWDDLAREAAHRPVWGRDVRRTGHATLVTDRPVRLDFGACGKGYLVDLIAGMLMEETGGFLIDAGGDLRIRTDTAGHEDTAEPITIGMEDPADPTRAVGVAHVADGSFCASAPSRRHWRIGGPDGRPMEVHHLVNALDGQPARDVAATWAFVAGPAGKAPKTTEPHPTAAADGLATALFVANPSALRASFAYDCAILNADRTARISPGFPGGFLTS